MTSITKYDVTNAFQIKMSKTWFNTKLGAYDAATDTFANSSFTMTVADIKELYISTNVINTGKLSTFNSDFTTYVNNYFGMTGGFETLFKAASEFRVISGSSAPDPPQFTGTEANILINSSDTIIPGTAGVSTLIGSIVLSNLNQLLKYAVDSNCFGNRTNTAETTFGVNNGFLAGDLLWIPDAFELTSNIAIDSEAILPFNNKGYTYTQSIIEGTSLFLSSTNASVNHITRTVRAPMLIKLI